jgi:hypothetical protein
MQYDASAAQLDVFTRRPTLSPVAASRPVAPVGVSARHATELPGRVPVPRAPAEVPSFHVAGSPR